MVRNSSFSVLLVGNFLADSRGTYSVCENLSARLREAGRPVITTSNKSGRLPRILDMSITAFRKRKEYSVAQVDLYSGKAFVWAETTCFILRKLRKPYVLTLHGGNLPAFSKRWPKRVNRLLGDAAAVTTPSFYLYEKIKCHHADLRLIPNALDISVFLIRPVYRVPDGYAAPFHHPM